MDIVVPNTLGLFGRGVSELRDLKLKKYFEIFPCFSRQGFKYRDFHEDIYLKNPNGWTDFDAQ